MELSHPIMKNFESINSHGCIYLGNISEPQDNSLRLVLEEGSFDDEERPLDPLMCEILGIPAPDPDKQTDIYEVIFNSYIGYTVLDESYVQAPHSSDETPLPVFRVYQQSKYLDFIKDSTQAVITHEGKLQQYSFKCLNHLIDVIASEPPVIRNIAKRSGASGVQLM